jgi:LPS sulfotransferase NodH
MHPDRSYRIWFTQRSGSTFLCELLSATGVAGKPGEHFNLMDKSSLCEKYEVNTYRDLKTQLWETGSTANGVFGIKHSKHNTAYYQLLEEIRGLRQIENKAAIDEAAIWGDLFPNCRHIYLTRRNKVRQAVSWWKAINDQVWHLREGETHQNEAGFYEKKYDFDALSHLFKETFLKECAIEDYFTKYHIAPLTIVYEDFVKDITGTIKSILNYLELDADSFDLSENYLRKTSSARSEQWVQRFRQDLQKDWEQKVW